MMSSLLYINPVAIGNIRWYAICIIIGIIIAVITGQKEGKKLGIYSDFIYVGILIIVPISVVGARLWYVLFNLNEFNDFADVIGLRGGLAGLGIQGGVIAAIISIYFYCKKNKISLYKTLDIVAPGFLIGQICGRWGNFCNHELYGGMIKNVDAFKLIFPDFITENMYIYGGYLLPGLEEGYYHPMFLYESMLNLVGLIIILILRRKSKKLLSGDLIGLYLIWYGIVRTITESFRHSGEVLMLGNIRVSIALSIVFIISGVSFLVLKRKFGPKRGYLDLLEEVAEHKIDTVIFDLDGTILDTRELINRSFIHVFEKYFPNYKLTDAELESFFGPTLYESFSKYEKDPKKIDEMVDYYRKYNWDAHDELVKAFPGVRETLSVLKKAKINLAIVSSKKKDVIVRGLECTGLNKYFDVIIGCDEVSKFKPDPEGINCAISYFEDAKNIIYVGDSPMDIIAGKNANVKTVAVLYSSKVADLLKLNPDYKINKFQDIVKLAGE